MSGLKLVSPGNGHIDDAGLTTPGGPKAPKIAAPQEKVSGNGEEVPSPRSQDSIEDEASQLLGIIEQLMRLDPGGIFMDPVEESFAPNYSKIIRTPMCFVVMQDKVRAGGYSSWRAFMDDFERICFNAMKYNQKRSKVWNAANALLRQGKKILENHTVVRQGKENHTKKGKHRLPGGVSSYSHTPKPEVGFLDAENGENENSRDGDEGHPGIDSKGLPAGPDSGVKFWAKAKDETNGPGELPESIIVEHVQADRKSAPKVWRGSERPQGFQPAASKGLRYASRDDFPFQPVPSKGIREPEGEATDRAWQSEPDGIITLLETGQLGTPGLKALEQIHLTPVDGVAVQELEEISIGQDTRDAVSAARLSSMKDTLFQLSEGYSGIQPYHMDEIAEATGWQGKARQPSGSGKQGMEVEQNIQVDVEEEGSMEAGLGEAHMMHDAKDQATECSTSFDNTLGDGESDVEMEIGEEVQSADGTGRDGNGAGLGNEEEGPATVPGIRQKRSLTADWKNHRRGVEWRCRWLELRMKELQLQARRYEQLLARWHLEREAHGAASDDARETALELRNEDRPHQPEPQQALRAESPGEPGDLLQASGELAQSVLHIAALMGSDSNQAAAELPAECPSLARLSPAGPDVSTEGDGPAQTLDAAASPVVPGHGRQEGQALPLSANDTLDVTSKSNFVSGVAAAGRMENAPADGKPLLEQAPVGSSSPVKITTGAQPATCTAGEELLPAVTGIRDATVASGAASVSVQQGEAAPGAAVAAKDRSTGDAGTPVAWAELPSRAARTEGREAVPRKVRLMHRRPRARREERVDILEYMGRHPLFSRYATKKKGREVLGPGGASDDTQMRDDGGVAVDSRRKGSSKAAMATLAVEPVESMEDLLGRIESLQGRVESLRNQLKRGVVSRKGTSGSNVGVRNQQRPTAPTPLRAAQNRPPPYPAASSRPNQSVHSPQAGSTAGGTALRSTTSGGSSRPGQMSLSPGLRTPPLSVGLRSSSPSSNPWGASPLGSSFKGGGNMLRRRASDYDINNMVMPVSVGTKYIEQVRHEHIDTPLWRIVEASPSEAAIGSGSSDEDTDDEVFLKRHEPLEAKERLRYMPPPTKKVTDGEPTLDGKSRPGNGKGSGKDQGAAAHQRQSEPGNPYSPPPLFSGAVPQGKRRRRDGGGHLAVAAAAPPPGPGSFIPTPGLPETSGAFGQGAPKRSKGEPGGMGEGGGRGSFWEGDAASGGGRQEGVLEWGMRSPGKGTSTGSGGSGGDGPRPFRRSHTHHVSRSPV